VATRMRAVSIRMSGADIRLIKRLADRLQVRDSDVVRYAVKSVLQRLAPLVDEGLRGRSLVPVLMETSEDLVRHFDLDMARLDAVVNGDEADASKRVDSEDLRIIAMHSMNPALANALNPNGPHVGSGNGERYGRDSNPEPYRSALNRYLYEKYVAPPPARADE
jgi:hypothetical protein